MAFPVSDDFNRANAIPAGGNWSPDGYCQTKIYNNTLRSSFSFGFMYWNADTPSADHWAECKSVNTSDRNAGPAVRIGTTSRNGYYYSVSSKTLTKYVNNTGTVLQTISSDTPNSTSVYRLEVSGTTLKVYKDGVQIGTDTTDSSHSSGYAGVFIGGANTGQVDDWQADNIPSTVVTGDNSTEANSTTSGAIVQENIVTGSNVTQANTSSSGAIVQTMLGEMLGDNSTQVNTSTSGYVTQPQTVTGSDVTQVNGSTSGAAVMTHALVATDNIQVNTSNNGAITQVQALTAGNSIQVNQSSSGKMAWTPGHWYDSSDYSANWNDEFVGNPDWTPSPPSTSIWN